MRKMTKMWLVVLCLAVVAAWSLPALADAGADQRSAQNKLLAYRAARVDAIRKLAERIKGLTITSETTVKDFVTESDTVQTGMMAFLNGMKEIKKEWMEDGTCEVVMEVTLQEVVVALKQICTSYYKGNRVKVRDIEKMTVTNELKVLRATGSGAPRPEFQVDDIVNIPQGGDLASLTNMSAGARAYWLARAMPQGRLMAVRAARIDALRRLGERINGLMITSETSVRDFVAESDEIRTRMRTFIQGAKEVGIRYHADELIVEVEMEVTVRELVGSLKKWHEEYYKGDRVKVQDFERLTVRSRDKTVRETGMGVPPEKYLKDVTAEERAVMALGANAPPWITDTKRAVGNAAMDAENPNQAQAKLMAYRGAELDARRKLAEELHGLRIRSNTTVRDFVADRDEIRTAMMTFQQGAGVVEGSQRLLEDGTAEVTVEIELKPLWNMILYYERKLSIKID